MRVFFSRQFMLFVLTGGIAAVVNFSSRTVYSQWTSYSTAIVLAYITGMITAFLLAKAFVFTDSAVPTRRSFVYFSLVNLLAVVQVWLVSMGLALYLLPSLGVARHVEEIAHAVGVLFPVFTSYLGHKYLSFRR